MAESNYTNKDVILPQCGNQLPSPLQLAVLEPKPFYSAEFQGEKATQPEKQGELYREEREWKDMQKILKRLTNRFLDSEKDATFVKEPIGG